MTAPLKELEEHRHTVTYGGPGYAGLSHRRVFRCPLGDVDTHYADGLALGSVLPAKWGGVSTSSPLDPRLHTRYHVQGKDSHMADIITDWVEITQRSPLQGDVWSPYEISSSGDASGTHNAFLGRRVCVITTAMAGSMRANYDPSIGGKGLWPGTSGALAPYQSRYDLQPMPERPGCQRLSLIYTEPQPLDVLQPGRAVLIVDVFGVQEKPTETYERHPTDASARYWNRITSGNVYVTDAEVTVRTAGTYANVKAYQSKIGKVNSNRLPNLEDAPAKTLLFLGVRITGTLIDRKWWELEYKFHYRPLEQDGDTGEYVCAFGRKGTKQKQIQTPLVVPVKQESGGAFVNYGTQTSQITIWRDSLDPISLDEIPGEADFSELDGWLGWY